MFIFSNKSLLTMKNGYQFKKYGCLSVFAEKGVRFS